VHGYHERTVADVPVDARRVQVVVRIRRLVCPARGCRQTFREQVPGVLERHQRRTPRLTARAGAVACGSSCPGDGRTCTAGGQPANSRSPIPLGMHSHAQRCRRG